MHDWIPVSPSPRLSSSAASLGSPTSRSIPAKPPSPFTPSSHRPDQCDTCCPWQGPTSLCALMNNCQQEHPRSSDLAAQSARSHPSPLARRRLLCLPQSAPLAAPSLQIHPRSSKVTLTDQITRLHERVRVPPEPALSCGTSSKNLCSSCMILSASPGCATLDRVVSKPQSYIHMT